MNVLLVNPYISDFTAYDLWIRPLGLYYLAAIIKENTDCQLFFLDALDRFSDPNNPIRNADGRGRFSRTIMQKPQLYTSIPRNYSRYGIPFELFQSKLASFPPIDLILITSLMTYWVDGLQETIAAIRRFHPKAPIVLGGMIPSLLPDPHQDFEHVDRYIRGYGEHSILDLILHYGGKIKNRPNFSHFNDLPFPNLQYATDHRAVPLMTSRGCPFHCLYCASPILHSNWQKREPDQVLREIRFRIEQWGSRHFILFDDALLADYPHHFIPIFSRFSDLGEITFHLPNGLHSALINKETARILHSAGFRTIRLAFESLSQDILHQSSDKATPAQMADAVADLEKAGYPRNEIEVYLLFGYPGQTPQEIEITLDFIEELQVIPRLSVFSPVPGTPLFDELVQKKILSQSIDLYETNKIYFLFQKSGLPDAEILRLKDRASSIMQKAQNKKSSRVLFS